MNNIIEYAFLALFILMFFFGSDILAFLGLSKTAKLKTRRKQIELEDAREKRRDDLARAESRYANISTQLYAADAQARTVPAANDALNEAFSHLSGARSSLDSGDANGAMEALTRSEQRYQHAIRLLIQPPDDPGGISIKK